MSAPATGPNRKPGRAGRREAVGLLDADPDLGAGLTPERREEADALVVHAAQLGVGAWQVARVRAPSGEYLGLLLLDGVISRELIIADTVSVELLGPGDLIRPWPAPDRTRLLRVDVHWWVLSSTSVAVLDRRVAAELGRMAGDRGLPARPPYRAIRAPGHHAGDLAADACRPAPADAVLVPGRALGPRRDRWRRGPAGADPPHARTARRRTPPDGLQRAARAR